MELQGIISEKVAKQMEYWGSVDTSTMMGYGLEKLTKGSEVVDKLFRFRANFVPNGIKLLSNHDFERPEIRVFNYEVLQVKLH